MARCRRHGRAEGSAVSKWQIEIWASHDTKDLNGYFLARRLLVDPKTPRLKHEVSLFESSTNILDARFNEQRACAMLCPRPANTQAPSYLYNLLQ